MLDTAFRYLDAAFQFILQGYPAQQVIPWFLTVIALIVVYMMFRMNKGDVK